MKVLGGVMLLIVGFVDFLFDVVVELLEVCCC